MSVTITSTVVRTIPQTVCGELMLDRRTSPDFLRNSYENTTGALFREVIDDYKPGSLGFPAAGHSQLVKYVWDQSQHFYWRGGVDSPLTTDPLLDGHSWDIANVWDEPNPSSLNDISITRGGNPSEVMRIADFKWLFDNSNPVGYWTPFFFCPWRAGIANGDQVSGGLMADWKNPEGKKTDGTAMNWTGGGTGVSINDTPTDEHMRILNQLYADHLWTTLGFPTAPTTDRLIPGIIHIGGEDWAGFDPDPVDGLFMWEPPAWNSATTYVAGRSRVTRASNVYRCILASTNNVPPNATYWVLESEADKQAWIASRIAYFGKKFYDYIVTTKGWTSFKWLTSFQESNAGGRIIVLPSATCTTNQKAVAKMLAADGGLGGSTLGTILDGLDFSGQYRKLWDMWKNVWSIPTPGEAFYEDYNPVTAKNGLISVSSVASTDGTTATVKGTRTYSSGTTYAVDDLVLSGSDIYKSLQASNTGHSPASNPTWWSLVQTGGGAITNLSGNYAAGEHIVIGPVDYYTDADTGKAAPVYLEGVVDTTPNAYTMTVKFAANANPIPNWGEAFLYSVGMRVMYLGIVYICAVKHTSSTLQEALDAGQFSGFLKDFNANPSKWTAERADNRTVDCPAPEWLPSHDYKNTQQVLNFVQYGGYIYECNTSHTSGNDSSGHTFSDDLAAGKWILQGPASTTAWPYTGASYTAPDLSVIGFAHGKRGQAAFTDFNDGEHIRLSFLADKTFSTGVSSWVSGTAYTANVSYVKRNSNVYICKTTNSDVTFTVAKWTLLGAVPSLSDAGTGTLYEMREWWATFMGYLSCNGPAIGTMPTPLNNSGISNIDLGLMAWSIGDVWDVENSVTLASKAEAAGLEMEEWQAGLVGAHYLMELADSGFTYANGFPGFNGERSEGTGAAVGGNTGGKSDTLWGKNPMFHAKRLISQIITHHDCSLLTLTKSSELLVPMMAVKWSETVSGATVNYMGIWVINKDTVSRNIPFTLPSSTWVATQVYNEDFPTVQSLARTGSSDCACSWSAASGTSNTLTIPPDTLGFFKFTI